MENPLLELLVQDVFPKPSASRVPEPSNHIGQLFDGLDLFG